jgi:MFS family permease
MKRGKHLKIAARKNPDIECQPDDQKIDITKEKQTAFYSALLEAWLETTMEKDKSLLMLSAGGVGILVTLLTTTGIHSRLVGFLFGAALSCFLASILLAISIFGRNADYIHCLINDKPVNEKPLNRRDRWMFWTFILGVVLSILIGLFSGIIRFQNQEADMSKEKPVNTTSTPQTYKKSFSGLSGLAPTSNPSSGQGQQGSGSNQGSSGSSQSSGSGQSSGQSSKK